MIYCKIKNLKEYAGIMKNLDVAIEYLEKNGTKNLSVGRNEVAGDDVYINVFEYETIFEDSGVFEAHNEYLDIHICLMGEEYIVVSDRDDLVPRGEFEKDKDCVLLDGDGVCYADINGENILVCFPSDAHMVKIAKNDISKVKKAVVKIRI